MREIEYEEMSVGTRVFLFFSVFATCFSFFVSGNPDIVDGIFKFPWWYLIFLSCVVYSLLFTKGFSRMPEVKSLSLGHVMVLIIGVALPAVVTCLAFFCAALLISLVLPGPVIVVRDVFGELVGFVTGGSE